METKNNLLSTKQAAKYIGVCEKTIYNYIRQGKLRPTRIGGTVKAGRTKIRVSEIEKLLKG